MISSVHFLNISQRQSRSAIHGCPKVKLTKPFPYSFCLFSFAHACITSALFPTLSATFRSANSLTFHTPYLGYRQFEVNVSKQKCPCYFHSASSSSPLASVIRFLCSYLIFTRWRRLMQLHFSCGWKSMCLLASLLLRLAVIRLLLWHPSGSSFRSDLPWPIDPILNASAFLFSVFLANNVNKRLRMEN